jgi:hypothetical protein
VKKAGLIFLVILALTLPFDISLVSGPGSGLRLTHLEVLLALVGVAAVFPYRRLQGCPGLWRKLPVSWRWLWLWLALAALLAAFMAPAFRWNALLGATRLLAGMGLALATLQLVTGSRQATWVLAALAAGGLIAAAVGVLEVALGSPLAWLDLFRAGPTRAGPFLRLSGPFNHANQAAMYLEAILPFWLAAVVCCWRSRWRPWTAVPLMATLLLAQALLLTLSRAALLMGLLSIVLTIFLLLRQEEVGSSYRRACFSLAAVGLGLLVVAVQVWASPDLQMRLFSEDDADWYRARLAAPPVVTMVAGQVVTLTIGVYHDGQHAWPPVSQYPIRLGAHWYRESDNYRLDAELRWPLPEMLNPDESLLLTVPLRAPLSPGNYRVEWDLVQEHVTWFSQKGGTPATSQVWVKPALSGAGEPPIPEVFRPAKPAGPPIPRRQVLWDVAWRHFLVYPWAGIGLDNYRLTYGRFLAWQHWNKTIHSNNWYLEMLVSLGLLGVLPFLAWLGLLWRELVATLRRPRPAAAQVVVAVALLAYAMHGLVDYFLNDRATGWLIWLLVGLWLAQKDDCAGSGGERKNECHSWP